MSEILTSLDEAGIATVTLNREHRKNGINKALVDQAIDSFIALAADDACRVVILTGAGSAFCSGMDLSERIEPDEVTFMRRVGQLVRLVKELHVPVIAKVRGAAFGYGANLAFCADLVVADDTAVFCEIFSERGLSIDGGGSWSIPKSVGIRRAKEILLLAPRIPAQDAVEFGLINRCVTPDELDPLVGDWATRLADGPKRALSQIKKQIDASYALSFAEAVEGEALGQSLAFRGKESREGARSFLEKRQPDFRSC